MISMYVKLELLLFSVDEHEHGQSSEQCVLQGEGNVHAEYRGSQVINH